MPPGERELRTMCRAVSKLYRIALDADDVLDCWNELNVASLGNDDPVKELVRRSSGRPHRNLSIGHVAALAVHRLDRFAGPMALASTVADLLEGAIDLDRQAYNRASDFADQMEEYRSGRAAAPKRQRERAARAKPPAARPSRVEDDAPSGGDGLGRTWVGRVVTYTRTDTDERCVALLGNVGDAELPSGARVVRPPLGSPLAKPLGDCTEGDTVTARLAGNDVELEIESVVEVSGAKTGSV